MSKLSNIVLWVAIIVIVVILIIIIGGETKTPTVEGEKIKIGAMLILSGDAASWGQTSQRAIDLAVKEKNEDGGINGKMIEIIYEDTQDSPTNSVSAFNKLVDIDQVDLIVGPNSSTEIGAIAPLASEKKIPVIAPSYAPLENRPDPRNPLCIWLAPSYGAEKMAEYVYDQEVKTISILGTQDSWDKKISTSFANKFKELGGDVLFEELVQTDATDVKTTITKAIKDSPQGFFIGSYYQFLNTTKTLKELGYKGKTYSVEVVEYLANESKDFSSGLEFINLDIYKDSFIEKYETEYGEKTNIPAGQTYDTMQIVFSFLEKDASREGLLEQMKNFSEYDGVSGNISITEDHKTIMPTAIYILNDGAIERVE